MRELGKAANEKIEKLLSDDQKKKLKEMGGEQFKGELNFPNPRSGLKPRRQN
jgi:hypothetical protein